MKRRPGLHGPKSVQDAEAHLAQTNLEVQSDEWNFNKEYKLQLDISVDDSKVYLPSGTLKVEPTWTTSYRALVQRGTCSTTRRTRPTCSTRPMGTSTSTSPSRGPSRSWPSRCAGVHCPPGGLDLRQRDRFRRPGP